MRSLAIGLLVAVSGLVARGQTASPGQPPEAPQAASAAPPAGELPPPQRLWRLDLTAVNIYEGNISHDPEPIRSYGFTPAAAVRYDSSAHDPAFTFGYEIAGNAYTGTDEWDRVSHAVFAVATSRVGDRLRVETGGSATWKGSSEDRELSDDVAVSARTIYRLTKSQRLVGIGVWQYKQYPDDPATSGLSPYVGAKFDQRLPAGRRLVAGFKYQTRNSHEPRDRYTRQAYTLDFSTPLLAATDRLTLGYEYRPQVYTERLIKIAPGVRALRRDRRHVIDAQYARPINARMDVLWQVGFERRTSNDPDKYFVAPSFGMAITCHIPLTRRSALR
jgi:hypothetical protein